MKIPHTEQELREKILRTLRIRPDDLLRYEIVRQSLDARGDELKYVYIIDAEVKKEAVNTEPVGDLLAFCHEPKTRQEIAAFLGVKTVFYAMQHYVQPLLAAAKLAMTIPEKPKSRNQKYYTVR